MSDALETRAATSPDFVPEQWPAERSDVPAVVRPVRGVLALPFMIMLWFLPKTMGVRLAKVGWTSALVAHGLGITIGAGLIVWSQFLYNLNPAGALTPDLALATWNDPRPHMPIHEFVTAPFAALVIVIHSAAAVRGWGIELGIAAICVLEAGMVILALILMPYAAAGERASLLFGRCLRLTWWSTTLLIPLGIGFMLDPIARRHLKLPNEWVPFDYARIALFGVYWSVVWVRSGFRYAGPPEGPGWQTRTPSCEGCGYAIVGIPVTTNCPECGRPVKDSLPERRCSPPFDDRLLGSRRIRAFAATCRSALWNRSFFGRLAIYRGHEDARSFFCAVAGLSALLILTGAFFLPIAKGTSSEFDNNLWSWVCVACIFLLSEVALSGLVAVIIAVTGRISIRAAAVISFWGSAVYLASSCVGAISFILIAAGRAALNRPITIWTVAPISLVLAILIVAVIFFLSASVRCLVGVFSMTWRAQG